LTHFGYSWSSFSNLLFVDNPIGTGYSKADKDSDLDSSEEEVAWDFVRFYDGFLEQHPEFKSRDLYITGGSYAGKYIPAISRALSPLHRVKGVAIGTGWVNPKL
jgi:cathepsin A (carboxypeptidase C)